MSLKSRTLRSKVKGMIVGGAIGDARWLPFETMSREEIEQADPQCLPTYFDPSGNKWFKGMKPGDVSDDTRYTVATMRGLILGDGFDMDAIAKAHIEEQRQGVRGEGKSTKEAIQKLAEGVSWRDSGKTDEPGRGTGNGVVMKLSPLAAWWAACDKTVPFNQRIVDYAAMTHYTTMAAYSALIHAWTLYDLLFMEPDRIDQVEVEGFLGISDFISEESAKTEEYDLFYYETAHLQQTQDDFFEVMKKLQRIANIRDLTPDQIRDLFGGGTSYVYHSLPTSYAYFFRNPSSFQAINDVGRSGGDTDSNAAIVGNMIGALHGMELFEQPENRWALEGLGCFEELDRLTDTFCDQFMIT